jgi:hypothetical protein
MMNGEIVPGVEIKQMLYSYKWRHVLQKHDGRVLSGWAPPTEPPPNMGFFLLLCSCLYIPFIIAVELQMLSVNQRKTLRIF